MIIVFNKKNALIPYPRTLLNYFFPYSYLFVLLLIVAFSTFATTRAIIKSLSRMLSSIGICYFNPATRTSYYFWSCHISFIFLSLSGFNIIPNLFTFIEPSLTGLPSLSNFQIRVSRKGFFLFLYRSGSIGSPLISLCANTPKPAPAKKDIAPIIIRTFVIPPHFPISFPTLYLYPQIKRGIKVSIIPTSIHIPPLTQYLSNSFFSSLNFS